jgi:hypothetical protein
MTLPKLKQTKNLAIPSESMTLLEFQEYIKEAEAGNFFTLQELTTKFDLWRKTLKK